MLEDTGQCPPVVLDLEPCESEGDVDSSSAISDNYQARQHVADSPGVKGHCVKLQRSSLVLGSDPKVLDWLGKNIKELYGTNGKYQYTLGQ